MKRAAAYCRAGRVFVHSQSQTKDGFWILAEPVLACDGGDTAAIGQCILEALRGSKHGVRTPDWRTDIANPLLQLAGIKSYNAFAKTAKSVGIELEDGHVRIIPSRNGGPRTGFVQIAEKTREATVDPSELGRELMAAFDDCEAD